MIINHRQKMRISVIYFVILSINQCYHAFVPINPTNDFHLKQKNELNILQNNVIKHNNNDSTARTWIKVSIGTLLCSIFLQQQQPLVAHAASFSSSSSKIVYKDIDRGSNWERSRQKRTVAIKEMESKGIIKVVTDDSGSQILRFPWIPDMQVPYKTLSIQQRLLNEVCAGAFGEFCKDLLLHPVDTLKTRRQAQKKKATASLDLSNNNNNNNTMEENESDTTTPAPFNPTDALTQLKSLYAGFPIVLSSSIPQGGTFFLIKKGLIETISVVIPATPEVIKSMVSIAFSVMGYWSFRTPAEIIKTQVQTGQASSVKESIETIRQENDGNFKVLWKYFPVMMWLDIPFQVMNFILYGIISEALTQAGFAPSTLTRLVCGVASGMVCAGLTCPVDVCKTRIISRDKENSRRQKLQREEAAEAVGGVVVGRGGGLGLGLGLASNEISPDTVPDFMVTQLNSNEVTRSEGQFDVVSSQGNSHNHATTTAVDDVVEEMGKDNNMESTTIAPTAELNTNTNVPVEMLRIFKEEGLGTLFLGLQPRLLYTGLANGIRLAAYGTSRMDLMMRTLDDI